MAAGHLYSSFVLSPSFVSGAAIFHAQAYIPTQPAQAIEEAWLSRAHEDPGRPESAFPPPRQGAQAGFREAGFPRVTVVVGVISSVETHGLPGFVVSAGGTQLAPPTVKPWMPSNKTGRFPRTARLLRHADFERVYKEGKRHFSASMTVFYLARKEEKPGPDARKVEIAASNQEMRVGFTVGRALGGAVQRNRMKRRLREAVRLAGMPKNVYADVVINPKKSLLAADFNALLNEVQRAFVVIEQKLAKELANGKTDGSLKPEVRR
jgi:ribonuclease P protein component